MGEGKKKKKGIAVSPQTTVWTCPIKVEPYNFWSPSPGICRVELPSFTVESAFSRRRRKRKDR